MLQNNPSLKALKEGKKEDGQKDAKKRGPLSYSSSGEKFLDSVPFEIDVKFGGAGEVSDQGLALYLHLFYGKDLKNEKLSLDETFQSVQNYIQSKLVFSELIMNDLYEESEFPVITAEAIKDFFKIFSMQPRRLVSSFVDDLITFIYIMLPLCLLPGGSEMKLEVGSLLKKVPFSHHNLELPEMLTLPQVSFFFCIFFFFSFFSFFFPSFPFPSFFF